MVPKLREREPVSSGVSALAFGDATRSEVPGDAVAEINFRYDARGVWKRAYIAAHCEVVLDLHARTESAFVHDALGVFAVVYQERHRRAGTLLLLTNFSAMSLAMNCTASSGLSPITNDALTLHDVTATGDVL
jgi:hypothetical protein